uniref:uncharacterized protein LOC101314470 isoform X2 n=1 Tax=Fragaria vesca subsp. vesca TaxID=101020 RepID=UPI0005C9B584|nr:PREDICTED: uncharacterized protein LOC101314470 isoform X2 [Fragaria vesca subsp. vesca]
MITSSLAHKMVGCDKKNGINKENFHKLRRGLKRSLKELEDLTHCTLFLDKSTLTAVGPSPRLWWVRNVWNFSITGKLSPAHVIRVFNRKLKRTTMKMGNSDTMMMGKSDFCVLEQPKINHQVSHPLPMQNSDTMLMEESDLCVLEQPKFSHKLSDPFPITEKCDFGHLEQPKFSDEFSDHLQMESCRSFRLISPENQAKLKEAWPMVESSLEELGYMCAMSTVDSTVLVVSPGSTDPDIMRKAKYLFKLLCKTPVPAPLAIELALHGRQHDLIKLGTQKGGMCKKYGINRDEFHKLQRRLKRSLKELEDLTHCTLFLNKNTLTAVGPSPRLGWVRRVLKICITEKLSPSHVISVFICKHDQRISFVRNVDVLNVKKTGHLMIEDGAAEVTLSDECKTCIK